MYYLNNIIFISVLAICFSCIENSHSEPDENEAPNILFIIADDLGKDVIAGYAEGEIKPFTPNIDAIRNDGLTFDNFWVYPTCTPTRASIITGKYGYRTNIKWASDELDQSESTLHEYIKTESNQNYSTALIGKWHLSGNNSNTNPEAFGIDYYSGLIRGSVNDYYQWQLTEDGISTTQTQYITQSFTNLSLKWIEEQTNPWFLWLAYNAPHTPFHAPPSFMHSQGELQEYEDDLDPIPYYLAAIEAMDYQIGLLLNNMTEEEREKTIIIFIGDNGTPPEVAQLPYSSNSVKGTLYEGGINVPMFISGKGVTRTGLDNNLITSTDLFATIAEMAKCDVTDINDSSSFYALLEQSSTIRKYQYSEMDNGNNDSWAISNGEYKLIIRSTGSEEMYHLLIDRYEQNNLLNNVLNLEESDAYNELNIELLNIRN